MHDISIVTATYNRKQLVCRSIDASLDILNKGFAKEIIIIDDASSDGTYEELYRKYPLEIEAGAIKIKRLEKNVGVSGAKNIGVKIANGNWVAFMDSDDLFLPNAGIDLNSSLSELYNYDLVFFRCADLSNKYLIGDQIGNYELTFRRFYNEGTPGECLPVVKRKTMMQFPYIESLRGCESLAYLRMLKGNCNAFVSDKIVRGYDTSGADRLSTKQTVRLRAPQLLKYNFLILKYFRDAELKTLHKIVVRLGYYLMLSLLLKVMDFKG